MSAADLPERVAAIVAEALSVPIERVTPTASLIDDLGAESIDFLDILFRLETAFNIKIRETDLWGNRPPDQAAGPELARRITVQTIIRHLQERGVE